jgi:S1-C subfamily serine protease
MKRLFPLLAVLFVSCLIAGCTSGPQATAANATSATNASVAPQAPPDTGTVTTQPTANASALPALLKELKKSVVHITYAGTHQEDYWGETDFAFIGSGVVYSAGNGKAYALTNRHVVDYNYPELYGKVESENITVRTSSGQTFGASERLVAPGLLDLAIVVFDTGNESVSAVSVSDALPEEGEDVLVIGMPEELNWSISKGIVSSIRSFTPLGLDMGRNYTAIQTDAAINPGNSGGGMFSTDGRLVGINSWKFGYFDEGLNFAVSVAGFPGLKSQFVPFPLASKGGRQPQGGAPAAIWDVEMGDYNYTTDSFSVSFALMDANGFPTSYTGPLLITLKDGNGTLMFRHSGAALMTDFRERDGPPFNGIKSYSLDVPVGGVTKTDSYYANLTVELTTPSGRLNRTAEIYVPDYLSSYGDYSGYGTYGDYGTYDDYGASGGAYAAPPANMKNFSVSSSSGGMTVALERGGMGEGEYGAPAYVAYVTLTNNGKERKYLDFYDATLVMDGRQYSTYPYYMGYVYPGASVGQELDFADVPYAGSSATLYITLDSYPSEDSYDYQTLDYKLDFKP